MPYRYLGMRQTRSKRKRESDKIKNSTDISSVFFSFEWNENTLIALSSVGRYVCVYVHHIALITRIACEVGSIASCARSTRTKTHSISACTVRRRMRVACLCVIERWYMFRSNRKWAAWENGIRWGIHNHISTPDRNSEHWFFFLFNSNDLYQSHWTVARTLYWFWD